MLKAFMDGIDTIPLKEVWPTFAKSKFGLRKIGKLVDDADIIIGDTAITYDMIMVTENTKHFENLPGIMLENWIRR